MSNLKLSSLLIIFGLSCYIFGIYLIWERNDPNRLRFKNYMGNYKNVPLSNPPVRILIRDLNIDLPVYPAKVVNNQWETTTMGASYLLSSPLPGVRGNSIIYAHDWASLFGPLVNIKRENKVEIDFEDKTKKFFIIKNTSVVSPDQSDILKNFGDTRLTLYTCTGFLDSKRFVAVATLQ